MSLLWAVSTFSIVVLVTVLVVALAVHRCLCPRRPAYLVCAALCAVAALTNLMAVSPWAALPWALCVLVWLARLVWPKKH